MRAALAGAVALAAVETGARLVEARGQEPGHRLVRVPPVSHEHGERDDSIDDTLLRTPDRSLLWRGRPSLSVSLPVVPSTTGKPAVWKLELESSGFRHVHSAPSTRRRTYRILFVGDSVTLGFNVDQGNEYPAVLERLAEERHPGLDVSVTNAAVEDWSWVQGAKFVVQEGLALAPDLVVAAHGLADAMPAWTTDSERIWLRERAAQARTPSILDRSAAWRLATREASATRDTDSLPAPSPGCLLQETGGKACRRVSVTEIGAMVRQIGDATTAAGVDLVLVSLELDGPSSTEAVHAAAIRENLRFVDFAKAMRLRLLAQSTQLSRTLGLAPPRVPLVPAGNFGPRLPKDRGLRLLFRVTSDHPLSAPRVRGRGPERTGFRFDAPLGDNGKDGDEKADDGVYSTIVETPLSVQKLDYLYFDGSAAEFETPPGIVASNADRVIRFNRDSESPIESFGKRALMSDRVHPDAEGHRHIAQAVLAEIEKIPAFARAVRESRDEGEVTR